MGAEVAKLSLWLATFVPGLSLAHLGRNVLVGDSLVALVAAERRAPAEEHRVSILGTAKTRAQWQQQAGAEGVGLLKSAFGPGWETPLLIQELV